MNCLHPFTRKYKDAVTGQWKEVLCPCGKCINCLHDYQEMWTIRLTETAKSYKQMIFDTLTVRPEAMHTLVDYTKPDWRCSDINSKGTLQGSTERFAQWKVNAMLKHYKAFKRYYPNVSYDSYKILRKNGLRTFNLPKEEIQKWIKRGAQFYTRDRGHRPNMSYFLVQEYGSKTSRCHFHILVFGLDYWEWQHYWGNPWREQFGWTKPVYKQFTPQNQKEYNCMIRYVSKYCSKGTFESPLVKDRLLPKTYRLISKGIGSGYLAKDYFEKWKTHDFDKFKEISCISEKTYSTLLQKYAHDKDWAKYYVLKREYAEKRAKVDNYFLGRNEDDFVRDCCDPSSIEKHRFHDTVDLSRFTDEDYDKITFYRDANGYPHALPRYYRDRLLNNKSNEPNVYKSEVQNVLQSRARVHDNSRLQAFAASLGYSIPNEYLDSQSPLRELSVGEAFVVDYEYRVAKGRQAKTLAERRYTQLKNFYNRAANNDAAPALQ